MPYAFMSPWSGQYTGRHMPRGLDSVEIRNRARDGTDFSEALWSGHNSYNPPFDPRIWATPHVSGINQPLLVRGRLGHWFTNASRWEDPEGNRRQRTYSLNFLYNPNMVTQSYSFNTNAPDVGVMGHNDTAPNLMTGQSMNFKLYFNRTYEVWQDDEHPGARADIIALERVLGTQVAEGAAPVSHPILVVFGATPKLKAFAFVGWIIGVEVQYMMFSHRMIPMIAEASISVARSMTPNRSEAGVTPVGGTTADFFNPHSDGMHHFDVQIGDRTVRHSLRPDELQAVIDRQGGLG